jgi:hypothetical protein
MTEKEALGYFWSEIQKYRNDYPMPNEEYELFIQHWMYRKNDKCKMHFEKQKTFVFKLRLRTWYQNYTKHGNRKITQQHATQSGAMELLAKLNSQA